MRLSCWLYLFVFRILFYGKNKVSYLTHIMKTKYSSACFTYRMTGMFQTSFYFGYTAILSLGMFCMLGFVGHTAAIQFVRKIYQNVKID